MKKGSICIIIENRSGHYFGIFEIVEVLFFDGTMYYCKNENKHQYVYKSDLFKIGNL